MHLKLWGVNTQGSSDPNCCAQGPLTAPGMRSSGKERSAGTGEGAGEYLPNGVKRTIQSMIPRSLQSPYTAPPFPMGAEVDSTQGSCEVNPQEGPAPG